jgi:hypothetical protein
MMHSRPPKGGTPVRLVARPFASEGTEAPAPDALSWLIWDDLPVDIPVFVDELAVLESYLGPLIDEVLSDRAAPRP